MQIYYKKVSIVSFCCLFSVILTGAVFGQNMYRKINDFDGDGKADFAVTRNENGSKYWYLWQTTNGFSLVPFGIAADRNYPGDYDGDGKWDFGVYRQQPAATPNFIAHSFWMGKSQTGAVAHEYFEAWNGVGYSSFQQDYDGDGKTDPTVLLSNTVNAQSIYIVRQSLSGQPASFGASGVGYTNVRTGDMTGDGKADKVEYHQTT